MIGSAGSFSRIAFDTAMAERSCGPPMTVTPTAPTDPSLTLRTAVATKSRSTLPSMIVDAYLPSSAADKLRTARGNARVTVRRDRRIDEQNTLRTSCLCSSGSTVRA